MNLRLADELTEEERQQLYGWGEDIFGMAGVGLQWRPKDRHLFVEVDGRVVTHVGLLQHAVRVGEDAVKVAGVGGVVTVGDQQGRGYASHAMRHVASLMCREWEVDFGMLFCREALVPFYQGLAWQRVEHPVEVEQPSGRIVFPLAVMVLPCKGQEWPAGPVRLESLPW
jgi:hypothetical protein